MPSKPRPRPFLLAFTLFIFTGACIQMMLNSRFVFFYAQQYKNVGWWVFLCLLPVAAIFMTMNVRAANELQVQYPTPWVRWLFMYPACVVLLAGMVVIAPLGWLTAAGWVFGSKTTAVPASVVSIEDYRSRKGCDQHATLSIFSTEATVCLADHYTGMPLQAGQKVLVSGQAVFYGFFISYIVRE